MSNRAARRREERAGRMAKSPKPVAIYPTINVFAKNGLFVQQISLGPEFVAEMKLDRELAENYVKECQDVVRELETGLKVERSRGLITP